MFLKSLKQYYNFDLRSLGLFRAALGLFFAHTVFLHYADLSALFTDQGVFPKSALAPEDFFPLRLLSFHALSGHIQYQSILCFIGFFIALLLIMGVFTPIVIACAWAFICSMHAGQPLLVSETDHMFRMLLFWSMFLPLHHWFSIDTDTLEKRFQSPRNYYFPGAVGMTLFLILLYWGQVRDWLVLDAWRSGEGALLTAESFWSAPLMVLPALERTDLLNALNYYLMFSCAIFPLLLICFKSHSWMRFYVLLGLLSLILLSGGLIGDLRFVMVQTIALLPFLPTKLWDFVHARLHGSYFRKINFGERAIGVRSKPLVKVVVICAFVVWFCGSFGLAKHFFIVHKLSHFFYLSQPARMTLSFQEWFAVEAEMRGGGILNVMNPGQEIDFEKPQRQEMYFSSGLWKTYFKQLMIQPEYIPDYLDSVCRANSKAFKTSFYKISKDAVYVLAEKECR